MKCVKSSLIHVIERDISDIIQSFVRRGSFNLKDTKEILGTHTCLITSEADHAFNFYVDAASYFFKADKQMFYLTKELKSTDNFSIKKKIVRDCRARLSIIGLSFSVFSLVIKELN